MLMYTKLTKSIKKNKDFFKFKIKNLEQIICSLFWFIAKVCLII